MSATGASAPIAATRLRVLPFAAEMAAGRVLPPADAAVWSDLRGGHLNVREIQTDLFRRVAALRAAGLVARDEDVGEFDLQVLLLTSVPAGFRQRQQAEANVFTAAARFE